MFVKNALKSQDTKNPAVNCGSNGISLMLRIVLVVYSKKTKKEMAAAHKYLRIKISFTTTVAAG